MINVLLAQQYLSAIFPHVPPWVWVLSVSTFVTLINIRGIQSTASLNSLFVYYQIAMVVAFIILCIKASQGHFSLEPIYNQNFSLHPIIAGATVLCFSFLGFDAVSNYAEEAINPKKDVPKAIILTALIGGGIFIVSSYFTQLIYPDASVFKDLENSSAAEISFNLGGRIFQIFFLAASFVGVFASGLASHASVSRLLYVMGRDNVLPKKFFGHLSEKQCIPIYNIIFVGVFCLSALFFTVENAVHAISFGSLIAFSFVNISVIAQYVIRDKKYKTKKDFCFNLLMPLIGLLVIIILWLNVKSLAFIFGSCWFIVGLVYLYFLKKMRQVDISKIIKFEGEL
jgi:putrescine importer